jgi:guanine deaminase
MEPASSVKPFDRERAERFMRRAIDLGRQGMQAGDGGPFGAVVVRDGQIVGEGWNRVVATNDPTAHGEILAIRAACRRASAFTLNGCELYTSGEPCPMCLGAIYWAHIDRVFYAASVEDAAHIGFDDRFIYDELAKRPDVRAIPETQVLAADARDLQRVYAASPKRVKY